MRRRAPFPARLLPLLGLLAVSVPAQPLPQVALEPVWPELKLERPVWMEEIPDDSGRFLIVEQDGRVWLVEEAHGGGRGHVVPEHR